MSSPLTSGILTGATVADRILRTRLAQAHHDRLQQEAEDRAERQEFDDKMRQGALLMDIQQSGAVRATPMDHAEAETERFRADESGKLTRTGTGTSLKDRLHDFGGDVGAWVFPKPQTAEDKFAQEMREARSRGEQDNELDVERQKSLDKLKPKEKLLPLPKTVTKKLGLPAGTAVSAAQYYGLVRAARDDKPPGRSELIKTPAGIFTQSADGTLTALKDPKTGKRLKPSTPGGEGSLSRQRFEQIKQDKNRAEINENDVKEAALHAKREQLTSELHEGKTVTEDGEEIELNDLSRKRRERDLKTINTELRRLLRRKHEMGFVNDEEFARFSAELRGEAAPAAAAQGQKTATGADIQAYADKHNITLKEAAKELRDAGF